MLVLGGGMHGGIEGRGHHCTKPSITSLGRIRGRWGGSQVIFRERLRRRPRRKTVGMTRQSQP